MMPLTFACVVVAPVSMSGLPPLAGFGGKWLLLSAMMDRVGMVLQSLPFSRPSWAFYTCFGLATRSSLVRKGQQLALAVEAPIALFDTAVRSGALYCLAFVLFRCWLWIRYRRHRSLFRLNTGLAGHVA